MSKPLTDAHHQWIRDVSGGACDPASYAPAAGMASDANADANAALDAEKKKFIALGRMWQDAEDSIRDDVDALYDELADHYDGDEHAPLMEQDFEEHVSRLFETIDGALTKDLAAVAAAKTMAECTTAAVDIRGTINTYMTFVQSDDVMQMIEQNPFIHLDTGKSCISTLQDMLRTLG